MSDTTKDAVQLTTELASMTRMFHAACADLGAINEALGLDPDDGGAEPIIDAIAELKAQIAKPLESDERIEFEAWMRGCEGYPYAGQYANLMWKAWQARSLFQKPEKQPCTSCDGEGLIGYHACPDCAQPVEPVAMDSGELEEFRQTVEDFDDNGETATPYDVLMYWAELDLLSCDHFTVTDKGRALLGHETAHFATPKNLSAAPSAAGLDDCLLTKGHK